jgi:hypothetical protein
MALAEARKEVCMTRYTTTFVIEHSAPTVHAAHVQAENAVQAAVTNVVSPLVLKVQVAPVAAEEAPALAPQRRRR